MKIFKWSNEFYDGVKYIAIHIVPACEFFWGILASVWKLPYGVEIGATIGGFGVFLGLCIGMSKREYQKAKDEVIDDGPGTIDVDN